MRRPLVARLLALTAIAAVAAACSGGDDDKAVSGGTTPSGDSVFTVDSDPTTTTIAPTTTFMPDCADMPTAADVSAAVGVPMADGAVVATGTCQYLGLNDQSRSVTVAVFSDPGDQATFNDLQASLGAPTPLDDPALAGAQVGVDGTVFITANGAIYTVLTQATDGSAAEQVPLSAAVLKAWLG